MKVLAFPAFSNGSRNPFGNLLYRTLQKQGIEVVEFEWSTCWREKCDIFHIHWPDATMNDRSRKRVVGNGVRLLLYILWSRLRGARLVWTMHNLQSHENFHPRLENLFWWAFVRQLDGVIALSQAGLNQAQAKRLGRRSIAATVIPHGHYRNAYRNEVSREEARRHLNIPASISTVVGWVGQLRYYKGLTELVDAWRKCPGTEQALLIAGHSSEQALRLMIEENAARDKRIRFYDGKIEDDDMQYYLNCSDVLVMPYLKILNSGSAMLALSFHRPVALPRNDTMLELQHKVGREWVYLYDGPFDEKVLKDIFQWVEQRPKLSELALDDLDWEGLGQQTIRFFQEARAADNSG